MARRIKLADLKENLANNLRRLGAPGNTAWIMKYKAALARLSGVSTLPNRDRSRLFSFIASPRDRPGAETFPLPGLNVTAPLSEIGSCQR